MDDATLRLIHQPVRLQIMAMLGRHRDVGFAQMRDALGLSDGNLSTHASKLEAVGWLTSRRALAKTGVAVHYEITRAGDGVLGEYAKWLRATLDALPGGSGE